LGTAARHLAKLGLVERSCTWRASWSSFERGSTALVVGTLGREGADEHPRAGHLQSNFPPKPLPLPDQLLVSPSKLYAHRYTTR
jgi:hypothetical protein